MTLVSKMSAQLAQSALGTPKANAPPAGTNPFGPGGGRGNLQYGQQTGVQSGEMSAEAREKLRSVVTRLSRGMLQDNPQGRAEHARCVALWENT